MMRASTIAIAMILPLLVASCARLESWPSAFSGEPSGTTDPATNATAASDMGEMSHEDMSHGDMPQSADPDVAMVIARMDQLEQDMAEVRIEMSRILPAIEQLNSTVQHNAANRAASLRHSDTAPSAIMEESRFAVHLASYRNRESAVEGWSQLRGRFGPVLNSLEPRLAEVDIEGRGTFYRLKAGPFANWAAANETCDYLRGESWSCAVMDFSGEVPE